MTAATRPASRDELREILEHRLSGLTLDERLEAVLDLVGNFADSIVTSETNPQERQDRMTEPEPSFTVEEITPHLAKEYLDHNRHNRALRTKVVSAYARDIVAGDWRWNGEAIKFDDEGALLDGQHRLAAIIEADLPVKMLVVRGLPHSTQETMDTGVKRRFNDVLRLRGEASANALAAIVNAVTGYQHFGGKAFSKRTNTNAELSKTLEVYPWLRQATEVADRARRHSAIFGSVAGLAYWVFALIDEEDARFFFDRLSSEEGHHEGEPIFVLRRSLASAAERSNARAAMSREYQLAIVIKAWNAYRMGETISLLRFKSGGAKPETFPEAI